MPTNNTQQRIESQLQWFWGFFSGFKRKPPGQWITVRSSRDKSPNSDPALSKSDRRRGFFSQDLSSCLEASNWEELQPRVKQDDFSESTVSAPQVQHDSSSSTCAEILQGNLLSMLGEAWESYGNSSHLRAFLASTTH